jgi:hypothetical protein
MTAVAIFVLLVVFGPPLVIVSGLLILCGIAAFSTDGPRRVRQTFQCPVSNRTVTADFAVPAGAAHPTSVVSCSAFSAFGHPTRVTCAQRCLDAAEVHWTPPVGLFGRWALISDGVVPFAGSTGRAPEPPAKVAA